METCNGNHQKPTVLDCINALAPITGTSEAIEAIRRWVNSLDNWNRYCIRSSGITGEVIISLHYDSELLDVDLLQFQLNFDTLFERQAYISLS